MTKAPTLSDRCPGALLGPSRERRSTCYYVYVDTTTSRTQAGTESLQCQALSGRIVRSLGAMAPSWRCAVGTLWPSSIQRANPCALPRHGAPLARGEAGDERLLRARAAATGRTGPGVASTRDASELGYNTLCVCRCERPRERDGTATRPRSGAIASQEEGREFRP